MGKALRQTDVKTNRHVPPSKQRPKAEAEDRPRSPLHTKTTNMKVSKTTSRSAKRQPKISVTAVSKYLQANEIQSMPAVTITPKPDRRTTWTKPAKPADYMYWKVKRKIEEGQTAEAPAAKRVKVDESHSESGNDTRTARPEATKPLEAEAKIESQAAHFTKALNAARDTEGGRSVTKADNELKRKRESKSEHSAKRPKYSNIERPIRSLGEDEKSKTTNVSVQRASKLGVGKKEMKPIAAAKKRKVEEFVNERPNKRQRVEPTKVDTSQRRLSRKAPKGRPHPRALHNSGNACFINASMQLLGSVPELIGMDAAPDADLHKWSVISDEGLWNLAMKKAEGRGVKRQLQSLRNVLEKPIVKESL